MADPMYRQIADDLRGQIESGDLEPGQQLPTELELRDHHEASRNTVRDAIKWLTSLGLVETRPGQGTFVARKEDPFVTTLTRKEGEVAEGGQSASLPLQGRGQPDTFQQRRPGRDTASPRARRHPASRRSG